MRKLATIRIIDEVQPIEGADAIEKVRIGGWWCVAKKGEFKNDDKCVYFEIDSLLPPVEPFLFLEKGGRKKTLFEGSEYEGYRLRTIKLRGQVSQGLALPLNLFTGISQDIGDDLSETIGVIKYEAPIPAQLAGEVKGSFPGFIPKTDEERIQNVPEFPEKYKRQKFYVTEKIDGTSATYYKYNGTFGVCSRNLELLENETNTYWKIAKEFGLADKLPEGYAIQCEIAGQGIQKNTLKLSGQRCFVFYVVDIKKYQYLTLQEMREFLKPLNMETVPVVSEEFILFHSCEQLLNMANCKSILNPHEDAEGLVFRLTGNSEKISFKAISNTYLLKNE
jgi:RNA ligase (TIGR02306 family)